jgi:hypothetical protein
MFHWSWFIIVVLCLLVWKSWQIILSMAEELTSKRNEVVRLKRALNDTGLELAELKRSIVNTGTMFLSGQSLSPKLLNKLIQFCHPDKHNNDPKAGMITAELIKIKNTLSI